MEKVKHFMAYLPDTPEACERFGDAEAFLHERFGRDTETTSDQMDGGHAYVLKVPAYDSDFLGVMERADISGGSARISVLVGLSNSNINGWYPRELWKFMAQDVRHEGAREPMELHEPEHAQAVPHGG